MRFLLLVFTLLAMVSCRTVKNNTAREQTDIDSSAITKKDSIGVSVKQEKKKRIELNDISVTTGSWDDIESLRNWLHGLENNSDAAEKNTPKGASPEKKKGGKKKPGGLMLHIGSAVISEEEKNEKDSGKVSENGQHMVSVKKKVKTKQKDTQSVLLVIPMLLTVGSSILFVILYRRVKFLNKS